MPTIELTGSIWHHFGPVNFDKIPPEAKELIVRSVYHSGVSFQVVNMLV